MPDLAFVVIAPTYAYPDYHINLNEDHLGSWSRDSWSDWGSLYFDHGSGTIEHHQLTRPVTTESGKAYWNAVSILMEIQHSPSTLRWAVCILFWKQRTKFEKSHQEQTKGCWLVGFWKLQKVPDRSSPLPKANPLPTVCPSLKNSPHRLIEPPHLILLPGTHNWWDCIATTAALSVFSGITDRTLPTAEGANKYGFSLGEICSTNVWSDETTHWRLVIVANTPEAVIQFSDLQTRSTGICRLIQSSRTQCWPALYWLSYVSNAEPNSLYSSVPNNILIFQNVCNGWQDRMKNLQKNHPAFCLWSFNI